MLIFHTWIDNRRFVDRYFDAIASILCRPVYLGLLAVFAIAVLSLFLLSLVHAKKIITMTTEH